MNRNNSLFHPLPLHALSGGPKPPGAGNTGPLSLNFSSPFAPSSHDNAAFRHLDPLGLRLMNPAAAAAAQLFAAQSHYNASVGRPTPGNFDPTTAALLLDPRYRSMMPPFGTSSPSSVLPSSPSNNSSSSSANASANNTHSHSHVHSHSHTHLHLGNNNDSSPSSNNSNGPTMPPPPPPPPPMLSFANPLSGRTFLNKSILL
jgi:hypothetical protein